MSIDDKKKVIPQESEILKTYSYLKAIEDLVGDIKENIGRKGLDVDILELIES